MEHKKRVNNISFSELYEPLFPSEKKGIKTCTDWKAAFKQQKLLEAENNIVPLEISYSIIKGNQLHKEEVGTKLNNIIKDNQRQTTLLK